MGNISIPAAFAAGLGFIEPAWRRVPAALLILVGFNTVFQALNLLGQGKGILIALLILVIQAFIGTLATGALYRMVIGPDHATDPDFQPGPGGVQWGGLEWRVLGANIVVGLIFAALLIVVVIVWVIGLSVLVANHAVDASEFEGFSGGTAEAMALLARFFTGPAGLVTFLIFLPAGLVALYLTARLSLYAVRAADTASFDMGKAWSMTGGATLAIAVVLLVYFIASALLGLAGGWVGNLIGGAMHASGANFGNPRVWTSLLVAVAIGAVGPPFIAGLVTFVYRSRNGGGTAVAEQFS